MNLPEKLEYLNQWQSCYEKSEAHYQKIKEIFSASPESLNACKIWEGFRAYTKAIAKIVGDKDEWLLWYWLENDMGKEGMKAENRNVIEPIRNLSQLLELIES